MRKKRLSILMMLCFVIVAFSAIFSLNVSAEERSALATYNFDQVVIKSAGLNAGKVKEEYLSYEFFYGDEENGLYGFPNVINDGEHTNWCLYNGDSIYNDSIITSFINPWGIRVSENSNTVIEITVLKDSFIELHHAAITFPEWMISAGCKINVKCIKEAKGNAFLLSDKEISSTCTTDYLLPSIGNCDVDDKIILVVYGGGTFSFAPNVNVYPQDDSPVVVGEKYVPTVSINTEKMFSNVIKAKNGIVKSFYADYIISNGVYPTEISAFPVMNRTDCLINSENTSWVSSFQSAVSVNNCNIFEWNANINSTITLSTNSAVDEWATNSNVKVIKVSEGTERVLCDKQVKAGSVEANYYVPEPIQFLKGDKLFYIHYTQNAGPLVMQIVPTIEFTAPVEKKFFEIKANCNVGGTVVPSTLSAEEGTTVEFTIDTWKDYTFVKAILNGEEVQLNENNKYKVENCTTSLDFFVEFKALHEWTNLSNMLSESVKKKGEPATSLSFADFSFGYGNIFDKINKFERVRGNGTDGALDTLYMGEEDITDNTPNFINCWSFRFSEGKDSIMAITAKRDCYPVIKHAALAADTWATWGYIKVVKKSGEEYRLISDKKIEASALADTYTGTELGNLKAGEIIYIIVYTPNASGGTVTFIPEFDFTEPKADKDIKVGEVIGPVETINYSSMVSESVLSNGEKIEKDCFDYQLMYGIVGESLKKLPNVSGTGMGVENDMLWVGETPFTDSAPVAFWRWQFRCFDNNSAVIKITIKKDSFVHMSHAKVEVEQWALTSFIAVLHENKNGTIVTLKDTQIKNNTTDDYYLTDVHAKAGDIIYIVYHVPTGGGTTQLLPVLSFNTTKYDESLRTDFSLIEELNAYKNKKVEELESYVESKGQTNYTDATWLTVLDIIDDYTQKIQSSENKDIIDEILTQAKVKIDEVKTKQQETQELETYKTDSKAEIDTFLIDYKQSDYSKSDWGKIVKAKNDTIQKIDDATNKTTIKNAISSFQNIVKNVKKKSKKTGCNSILGYENMLILFACGVITLFKKRIKD